MCAITNANDGWGETRWKSGTDDNSTILWADTLGEPIIPLCDSHVEVWAQKSPHQTDQTQPKSFSKPVRPPLQETVCIFAVGEKNNYQQTTAEIRRICLEKNTPTAQQLSKPVKTQTASNGKLALHVFLPPPQLFETFRDWPWRDVGRWVCATCCWLPWI